MTFRPFTSLDVLLVDDNQADVLLTEVAFASSGRPARLRFARDGQDALDQLQLPGSVPPHLILLDINMPRMNGFELLSCLRSQPSFRGIPVVMLSTSAAPQDVDRAYQLGANAFVTKPVDLPCFLALVEKLLDFWLTLASLPTRVPSA